METPFLKVLPAVLSQRHLHDTLSHKSAFSFRIIALNIRLIYELDVDLDFIYLYIPCI